MKLLIFLCALLTGTYVWAASIGGSGGGERPGYVPVNYVKSSQCAANEWRVNWQYVANTDHGPQDFWTCEKEPLKESQYVHNPNVKCQETGKPQPVTVPTPNGRSQMKWEICKGGRYVLYDP
jgi:hypothetical protein